MKIREIQELLGARVIIGEESLDKDVCSACGSDMMSDVLAYVKDQAVLLTGLVMQEGFSTTPDTMRSLGFGAGMGLPNMKRYTDKMDIESELGKGTKITMTVNVGT